MKKTLQIPTSIKLLSVAVLIQAGAVHAAATAAPETVSYLSGGIGVDGRQDMHTQRKNFNLHLRFAQGKTGEYISGVNVVLTPRSHKGEPLQFQEVGPWLYVNLNPGSYRLTAEAEGKKQVRTLSIGTRPTEAVIYWQ